MLLRPFSPSTEIARQFEMAITASDPYFAIDPMREMAFANKFREHRSL
jgi:hypothetical protein